MRKLMPALYRRVPCRPDHSGHPALSPWRAAIIDARRLSRRRWRRSAARTWARANSMRCAGRPSRRGGLPAGGRHRPEDFDRLAAKLKGSEDRVRVMFLSTAPNLFTSTCENLAARQARHPEIARGAGEAAGPGSRLGGSHQSNVVGAIFTEKQIYRIDHYLGKETVQNLIALRFGNTLFEPLWRRGRIRHVQITVGEQSASKAAARSTTRPARCATWCRTTCCNCCASWPWSRRRSSDAGRRAR